MGNTRYADEAGDVWESYRGTEDVQLISREGDPVIGGPVYSLADVIAKFGPISLAPDRCEEIRTAALETVLMSLPSSSGDTYTDDDGNVCVTTAGSRYSVDVTVTQQGGEHG